MLVANNALSSNLNRGAFVVSCVSGLADIAWKERESITNVAINKIICYTRPVALEPFGVISLAIVIDNLAKATIPEVHLAATEQEFLTKIASLRNYTTHVVECNATSLEDAVSVEYPARTGVSLSNYISVGLSSMQVFSQIVGECIQAMNAYFAKVNYDVNTILYGFDKPTLDTIHDQNLFQFLNSEIAIILNMFRINPDGNLDYDFNIGLLLTAMRSGKDDSKFSGVRL